MTELGASPRLTLHALAARVAELERRLASTAAGSGPRDGADVVLVRSLYDQLGALPFRPADVFKFSRLERGAQVRAALRGADVDNPHQLGKLLARLSTRSIAGLQVTRHRRRRHWVVSAMSNDTPR